MKKKKTILKISVCLALAMILPLSMCSCARKNRDSGKLIEAIHEKNIEEVRRLLEEGVDPNVPDIPESKFYDFLQRFEWTPREYPLPEACGWAINYEIVKLLIDHGATTDFSDKDCLSPLYRAVDINYYPDTLQVVELLLENGADVNCKEYGDYPVERAASMSPQKYHPGMKNGSDFEDGYDEETAKGIVEVVKLLIGRMDHFDVNEGSYTLLMSAASRGNIALAEYLLSIGADKTIETSEGHKTAYDYAIDNGHVELAELLKP